MKTLGAGTGYLKAGFLGFAASGKTHTAIRLAVGLRKRMGLEGPIAMFDTEGGSEYVAGHVLEETGTQLVGERSRSLADLMSLANEALESGASCLVVDSVTHVWREVCDSYKSRVNAALAKRGQSEKTRLEFQDWAKIKDTWAQWPDFYLNSPMHIIICGRAGFEWEFEEREDEATGKVSKELIKTGTKMKVEGEFGFEPSLLVEMERVQIREGGKLTKAFLRRATVLKDRFDVMDGDTCENPTYDFFEPHISRLVPGAHAPVDTSLKTDPGLDESGDTGFYRERKLRTILCEKIQAELLERWPGQTAKEKKAKKNAVEVALGTPSWTEIETKLNSEELHRGLETLRQMEAVA